MIELNIIDLYFLSFQGKCQRKEPPCKYLHPPQHLKEQLLQNGRNNLIIKNLQYQALTSGVTPIPTVPTMPLVSTDSSPHSKQLSLSEAHASGFQEN